MIDRALFALVFLAAIGCALAAGSYFWWSYPSGKLLLIAALLYIVGSFGLTMAVNQPLNLQLAALQPAQAIAFWPQYVASWTIWNHVRTVAPLVSMALFVAALLFRRALP